MDKETKLYVIDCSIGVLIILSAGLYTIFFNEGVSNNNYVLFIGVGFGILIRRVLIFSYQGIKQAHQMGEIKDDK